MKNIILCSLMLNIGCSEVEKETEAAQNDNKSYFEGDSTGDCTDGEDNDEDGLIDCDDNNALLLEQSMTWIAMVF